MYTFYKGGYLYFSLSELKAQVSFSEHDYLSTVYVCLYTVENFNYF